MQGIFALVCFLVALVLFALAAIGIASRLNLIGAGLFFVVLGALVERNPGW